MFSPSRCRVLVRLGLSHRASPSAHNNLPQPAAAPRAHTAGLLRALLLPALMLPFCLAGCASHSSSSSGPVTPALSLSLVSPASGTMVKSLPLTLQLQVSGATAALPANAVLLNGADISSSFTVQPGGSATATLSGSAVFIGSNRIDLASTGSTTTSRFTYDPTTAGSPSPQLPSSAAVGGSPDAFSDVVPIKTRIAQGSYTSPPQPNVPSVPKVTRWGIQVGTQMYWQPDTTVSGFQVLLLNRSDLSVISNTDYPIDTPDQANLLGAAIDPISGTSNLAKCGPSGCLMIIQSLFSVGAISCAPTDGCSQFSQAFADIGGTNVLPGSTQIDLGPVGYSFVGNVGSQQLHAGSNYERITCYSADGCLQTGAPGPDNTLNGVVPNGADGVTATLANTSDGVFTPINSDQTNFSYSNGQIAGVLVLDNYDKYTFTYPDLPIHYATGLDPNNLGKAEVQLSVTLPAPTATTPQVKSPLNGGVTTITDESAALPPNTGGFLLTAFDATTFQSLLNSTFVTNSSACVPMSATQNYCKGPDGTPLYTVDQIATQIRSLGTRRAIFFLQSIGNLDHPGTFQGYPRTGYYNETLSDQDAWDKAAQGVQDIGGTFATFVSLNNQAYGKDLYDQYLKNTVPADDYTMVGQWWFNNSGVPNPLASEESTQISRQTIKAWGASRMTGLLFKEQDGYYRVSAESAYGDDFPSGSLTFLSAPNMFPVPWPLTDGPNATAGLQNAYQWVSQQVMGCADGCNSIRAAYPNLNQDPSAWLAILEGLQAPVSCASTCDQNFSTADFNATKAQLVQELRYLAVIRNFQSNMLGMLQAEQVNQGVILQQELDSILSTTNFNQTSTTYGVQSWRNWVSDALKIAGPGAGVGAAALIGFGVITGGAAAPLIVGGAGVAFALGASALNLSAKTTNTNYGAPLAEEQHEQVAASLLAGNTADQYTAILTSAGHNFDRIVSDWGRLSTLGSAITNNDLVWDGEATGLMLKSFDLTARRQFTQTILKAGYQVNHYRYAAPGVHSNGYQPNSEQCPYYLFMAHQADGNQTDPSTNQTYASYAYIPGAPIDGLAYTLGDTGNVYPNDLWWDVWTMTEQSELFQGCTRTSKMPPNSLFLNTGIFTPIDPNNPNALGIYKTWFYQRNFAGSISHIETSSDGRTYWDGPVGSNDPFHFGDGPAQPDPDNY